MTINYWKLFLVALALLVGLIIWRWIAAMGPSEGHLFPSPENTPQHNTAAWVMIGIAIWGLLRLFRKRK